MSLYPYICKYFKFPVGHPVIQVGNACRDIEACLRMEGLIKCLIVPPDNCTIPSFPTDVLINSCSVYVEHLLSPLVQNVRIQRMRIEPSQVP